MNALDKKQRLERAALSQAMRDAAKQLDLACVAYNETLKDALRPVEDALKEYNAALEKGREFAEQITADLQSHYDGMTEDWQESEHGAECWELIDEWEQASLEDVDIELPDELEVPDLSEADALENLPENSAQ